MLKRLFVSSAVLLGLAAGVIAAPYVAFTIPSEVNPGSSVLTFVVFGDGFTESSKVMWNGEERFTIFFTDTEIRGIITAEDMQNVGIGRITVETNGEISNPVLVKIGAGLLHIKNRDAYQPIMQNASSRFGFVVSGRVKVVDDGVFCLWDGSKADDGTSLMIEVELGDHGLVDDNWVTVKGLLDVSGPRVRLFAAEITSYEIL